MFVQHARIIALAIILSATVIVVVTGEKWLYVVLVSSVPIIYAFVMMTHDAIADKRGWLPHKPT